MSSDYKVLVVVDLQNCFIHGGSISSLDILDLKKYIALVKDVALKISNNNYDLVVFTKDSHPLNHSSLSDKTNASDGVFIHHCRNSKHNCIKDKTSTYISTDAKDKIRDFIFSMDKAENSNDEKKEKEQFYVKKEIYQDDDYNFYNPKKNNKFNTLLINPDSKYERQKSEILDLINNNNYKKKSTRTTLNDLIKKYNSDPNLDDESKKFLNDIDSNFMNIPVEGLDLNYLFYGTNLKDEIFKLNQDKKYEIGIVDGNIIADIPKYDDAKYNVNNVQNIYKDNTRFISLEKGQYCNYESYSAFNYHIHIKKDEKSLIKKIFKRYDSTLNVLETLPAIKNNSTGLFEYILKSFKDKGDNSKTNINIDVCGLVANICVINTVHQGIAMWEKIYKKEAGENISCKFNFLEYLTIPLSISEPDIPYLNYSYSQQINKEEDLGKLLLQINNLKTLFNTKFQYDVVAKNPDIKEISYTVDFNIDDLQGKLTEFINQFNQLNQNIINSKFNLAHFNNPQQGGNRLKYKHKKLIRNKVKKNDKAVYIATKKEILGKKRCIYKKPDDLKEYLKYKGGLITVSEYKKLMKSKLNAK